jgi:hypothetical protein
MTNIKFTKKGRHPRRNNGGVSSGKKEQQWGKLFEQYTDNGYDTEEKKELSNNDKKWNQLNFK